MWVPPKLFAQCHLVLFFLLTFLGIFACTEPKKPEKPPIEMPFSLSNGGEKIEFEIKIVEAQTYTFGFGFFVNKHIPNDVYRLMELLGESKNNNNSVFGVPLMIRLQVRSMEKIPPFEFDKIETEIPVYSWNPYSRNTRIVNIKLFPGIYRVKVENLLAAPDFAGRKINFQIYKAYFGK